MNIHRASNLRPQASIPARGFTLAELLVVMGIMAILGVLTALSYRGIARDAKLASGKNTVAAVLDNARGLAMKNNRIVVAVFRPRLDGPHEQYVEAVFAQWTGDSARIIVTGTIGEQVIDMFRPIDGVPARILPKGIKIGAPQYFDDEDGMWSTLTHLPNGASEAAGPIIGVMYAPDGTTISRNSATGSHRMFIDFDNNGMQDSSVAVVNYFLGVPTISANDYFNLGNQYLEDDEAYIEVAPFLAVLDDDEVRELYSVAAWGAVGVRENNYSQYINNNVDPIYFNRYTGVVMKK